MVWFACEDCGDSIKKPKLQSHLSQCSASRLTCIDCNSTFNQREAKAHNQCVTEHEKYAQGVTKPGGYASNGYNNPSVSREGATVDLDLKYLSTRAPWTCSVCSVTCTSKDTLLGHAGGAKHQRRAKAASAQNAAPRPATLPLKDGLGQEQVVLATRAQAEKRQMTDDEPSPPSAKKWKAEGNTSARTGEGNMDHPHAVNSEKNSKPVKWKKLATQELRCNGGSLSLTKLQKQLLKAVGRQGSKSAKAEMLKRIQGSSKFAYQDGQIKLL